MSPFRLPPLLPPYTFPLRPLRPVGPLRPLERFSPPRYRIEIPENLGRPPNSRDVTVHQGFDGRTPDEAVRLMRSALQNPVLPENEALVDKTLRGAHQAFTIHLSNVFIPGSPHQQLLRQFGPDAQVTVLGLARADTPHAFKVQVPGQPPRYFMVGAVDFEEHATLPYKVVMEADVQLDPPGLRPLRYPQWSLPALARKLTTVTEL